MSENIVLELSIRLEGVLRTYLHCEYSDFGVKANGNIDSGTWKNPIWFALGHRLGKSGNDEKLKNEIDFFLDNELIGKNIGSIINDYAQEGFDSREEAIEEVERLIDEIERLLK